MTYELTGLGNAIVDVIATGTDAFLEENGIIKGAMNLIDEARAKELYAALGPATETSGGSGANTMAGFASFGGKGAYLGKVADDQLGEIFTHDIKACGIHYNIAPLKNGPETARCMIVVTPDAERSMNTFLGATSEFEESDVDEHIIQSSEIVYLEGYLYDRDKAKQSYVKASKLAHASGAKVALTLSDTFCVERHRNDFQTLIENEVDILFANEEEAKALYQNDNIEDAINALENKCAIIVITRSEKGSLILCEGERIEIPAHTVEHVVDTTGAGDQYAAGFLFGLAKNYDLAVCGKLGSLAASEVISHIGARPAVSLAELAQSELGLKCAA